MEVPKFLKNNPQEIPNFGTGKRSGINSHEPLTFNIEERYNPWPHRNKRER